MVIYSCVTTPLKNFYQNFGFYRNITHTKKHICENQERKPLYHIPLLKHLTAYFAAQGITMRREIVCYTTSSDRMASISIIIFKAKYQRYY